MPREDDPGRPRGGPQTGPAAKPDGQHSGLETGAKSGSDPDAGPGTVFVADAPGPTLNGPPESPPSRSGGERSAAGSNYGDWHGGPGENSGPAASDTRPVLPVEIGSDYASQGTTRPYSRGTQDFARTPVVKQR